MLNKDGDIIEVDANNGIVRKLIILIICNNYI